MTCASIRSAAVSKLETKKNSIKMSRDYKSELNVYCQKYFDGRKATYDTELEQSPATSPHSPASSVNRQISYVLAFFYFFKMLTLYFF